MEKPGGLHGQIYTLYCIPHAGASEAAFTQWKATAAGQGVEVIPVELPGHGRRWREEPISEMSALVPMLCDDVLNAPGPFGVLGHSVGAWIAFAVAIEFERRYGAANSPVCHVFVSGARSPQRRDRRQLHLLPDASLVRHLRELNGTSPEVLRNRQVMELMLPVVRADLILGECWTTAPGTRISASITAMGGLADKLAEPPDVAAWAQNTEGTFDELLFPGGHFFIQEHAATLIPEIAARLRASACRRRRPRPISSREHRTFPGNAVR
jgi:medium-chain acyl-[acyl-carrier-protein] hydrolase